MKHIFSVFIFTALFIPCSYSQQLTVVSGKVERLANFPSKYIQPRNVDVWLPEGYSQTKNYTVLYMHDGQMLFDTATTWNHQEWGVDETVSQLLNEHKIKDVIVVGIWNNGKYRHSDYFPQKPLQALPKNVRDTIIKNELEGKPQADNYLLFLVKELKPYIDSAYNTYADRRHTFVAGSSMGGLISFYAICEYPSVFGGAACLSTHWPGSLKQKPGIIPKAFNQYLLKHLPSAENHRIYFDYGTATLDSLYEPYQLMVNRTMKAKGYTKKNWITKKFEGDSHTETAWQKRLHIPIEFLVGK